MVDHRHGTRRAALWYAAVMHWTPLHASVVALALLTGCPLDIGVCDTPWYRDTDGDGYGDASAVEVACDAPDGTVSEAGDCDDADSSVSPRAVELCDGLDNDCDGSVDLACRDCDEAVPNHFGTITDALAVAADGDTICVGPGTYGENLDFGGLQPVIDGFSNRTSRGSQGGRTGTRHGE